MSNEEIIIEKQETMNPILQSLIKPRETIKHVIDSDRTKYYRILICLYGFLKSMDNYARRDYSVSALVIIILVILSPISGYIGCYLYAWLMSLSGKVLKGRADSEELRLSILWSTVPMMIILPISIITFILGADNIYGTLNIGFIIIYWMLAIIEMVFAVWIFINLIRMVSEVQGFSKRKALLSIILPFVVLVSIILAIVIPINIAL